ncbi:insulin receptor substrate 1 isoform X2 [Drosophila grimshawi]|nr:insulin receptor substrate 1 isoform X2 [Drosophila grimshawi]
MMASKSDNGIVLSGFQKKLKTMKKKFFVLYKETNNGAARLEYYDTEKKFLQKTAPKRVIDLKSCFNINRRFDTKHKFVLALASRDGGFGIVLNSENDLRKWLDNLLILQRDNTPYEYVWQVVVQKKGMSETVGITGGYHCCLTSKSLTFICIGPEKQPNGDGRLLKVEINLPTIRRCGHAAPQSIFYMELGRQSVLGAGELWMETEDSAAKHMHDMILSAMSVKSESNMNLLNVYKGKPDLGSEPMRKRSSSATEASKPINVLQKRQNPIEIRNSFSPQYNSYGRERCDSLPSRNRTLSECSNQTYIAYKHGHRCNTISGTRPYSSQRHSDSPPINSAMKCSESEESSISIDEANDKSIYDAYRINSRTSKCMIPEENVDDLNVSDSNKLSGINENFAHYISMTPNKSMCENLNVNANHQLNQCTELNTFCNVVEEDFIDFPEHSSEKLAKDAEIDNQYERPSRAYSIGSKVEHIKMSKPLGNLNEVDNSSPRVRAYSVGSKSKIPRCDIQRCVLFSNKGKNWGHTHKGSVCNVDVQACSEHIGYNTSREMKSTSAPLLNLRSYVNPLRMSDLMEIDFSNVTTASSTTQQPRAVLRNYHQQQPSAIQTKKNPVAILPNSSSNGNIRQITEMLKPETIPKSVDSSDVGYLEMKPVGVGIVHMSHRPPICIEDQLEKLKLLNSTQQQQLVSPPLQHTRMLQPDKLQMNNDNSNCYAVSETNADLSDTNTILTNNLNQNNADKNYHLIKSHMNRRGMHTKLENNQLEKTLFNFALDISNSTPTAGRKLIHSISNEDYTKHINKSNAGPDTKGIGYQILQIKSDSSLISKKKNQRPIHKPQYGRQFSIDGAHKMEKKLLITNTTPTATTTTTNTACNNLSSPSSSLLLNKPESKLLNEDSVSNKDASSTNKDDNASSSSGSGDHALYYASLDLPQSSGQTTTKCLKKVACESPPANVVCFENTTSSYAKIDFDQSDSSSASSKICNI